MAMEYCMECGARLEKRFLENEGMIPFCPECGKYRFPVFNTAVSMIVMPETRDRVLLIQQYGRTYNILVAGYVNKGENAEHAVIREVKEETGLDVVSLSYNRSAYFEPSNTLMLNFSCVVSDDGLGGVTSEIDSASWYGLDEARKAIRQGSLAQSFLESFLSGMGKT